MKTREEISKKISNGTARVFTAGELRKKIREGEKLSAADVDVVTCGTFGVMSGTFAVLGFQVAEPGMFQHANSVTLNGVPGFIGPCPNENNGHLDCIVYGTSRSVSDERYGGGHLFRDLVEGKKISAEIFSGEKKFCKEIFLSEFSSAKIITSRAAFKNYLAFVNPTDSPFPTIFSVVPMPERFGGVSASGCGEINPLENDPKLLHHTLGSPVLLNGAKGCIIGTGTRSTREKPNLTLAADMKLMDADLMGGFATSLGPECLTSVATAIPVLDEETFAEVSIMDENIPLPIADVTTRTPFDEASYADLWAGDKRPAAHSEFCESSCETCVKDICPVNAISEDRRITSRCMGCLTCVSFCPNSVYTANRGTLNEVPIILRQSDRVRGEKAAGILKEKIRKGEWRL